MIIFKRLTSIPILLSLSILIMSGTFLLKMGSLPPQIPLFYSRLEGDQQIVDLLMIFILPSVSSTLVAGNNFILRKYFKDNHFVTLIIYYINLSVILIIAFIFVRIIFLVT